MNRILNFAINELYSHEEIYRSLGVGNAGGIRFKLNDNGSTQRAVLFTSVPQGRVQSENPYHDRIENDVLVYTAQGRNGDQGFGGQNQRLLFHGDQLFPIYCFQLICSRRNTTIGTKRWRFVGLLFGLRRYKEKQIDIFGNMRTACIFEFAILSNFPRVYVDYDAQFARSLYLDYIEKNGASYAREEEVSSRVEEISTDFTPEELEKTRSQMLALHPSKFENLVHVALEKTGCVRVTTTKYSQDGGIEVDAYVGDNIWALSNLHLQVQAKRWIHTVGRREVAELRGSLSQFARGVIVTTSQFSRSALDEAREDGKLPIVTIDGYDFAKVIKKFKIGVA